MNGRANYGFATTSSIGGNGDIHLQNVHQQPNTSNNGPFSPGAHAATMSVHQSNFLRNNNNNNNNLHETEAAAAAASSSSTSTRLPTNFATLRSDCLSQSILDQLCTSKMPILILPCEPTNSTSMNRPVNVFQGSNFGPANTWIPCQVTLPNVSSSGTYNVSYRCFCLIFGFTSTYCHDVSIARF